MSDTPDRRSRRERAITRLKRYWRRILLACMLIALVGVYFLPAAAVHSPLKGLILARLSENLDGQLHCGAIRAGWFSSVRVEDLALLDGRGEQAVEAASVSTEASLMGLLLNGSNPGLVTIERPVVRLLVRNGGSNLEDILQPLLQADSTSSAGRYEIQINDGRAELADRGGRELGDVAVSGKASWDASESKAVWSLKTQWRGGANTVGGRFDCDGEMTVAESSPSSGAVRWRADGAALGAADAVSIRFGSAAQFGGSLDGEGEVEWSDEGALARVSQLQVIELDIAGVTQLNGDRLRSSTTTLRGSVFLGADELRCRELQVTTDWASANASADIRLVELQDALSRREWRRFADALRGELRGAVDLAALSQALPNALHLRRDTQIEEGAVDFHLVNSFAESGRRIEAHVRTQPLRAVTSGATVQWRDMMQLDAAALITEKGWNVERAVCRSDFITVEGSGPPEQGQFQLDGDLDRLRDRLQQFVDLGDWKFGGRMQGRGHWRRNADALDLGGALEVHDFNFAFDGKTWREPRIDVSASARFALGERPAPAWKPESWRAELRMNRDLAAVEPSGAGYLIVAQGDLGQWSRLAEMLGVESQVQLSGRFAAEAEVDWSSDAVVVRDSTCELEQLQVRAADRTIDEPQVTIRVSGQWDAKRSRWTTKELRLQTETLAAASNSLLVELKPQLTADAAFSVRGDLRRLRRWAPEIAAAGVSGDVVGAAALAIGTDRYEATWDLEVDRFAVQLGTEQRGVRPVSRSAQALWREPKLQTKGGAVYRPPTRRLTLKPSTVSTQWLDIQVEGDADMSGRQTVVSLQGSADYDWTTAMQRLELGDGDVRLYGRRKHSFRIHGPVQSAAVHLSDAAGRAEAGRGVVSPELVGAASLGWDRAEAFGFDIGPATIDANLNRQVASVQPIRTTINDGRLLLTPRLDLSASEPILSLAKRDGVSNVTLTAEMCHGWLKYIAPSVANATSADGSLSVQLSELRTPLGDTARMQAGGTLQIHEARVGPGQVTRRLIQSVQQLLVIVDPEAAAELARPTWMEIPEQPVEFFVRDGRVTHQQMVFRIRDASVVTSGSVGFDQTLDLLVEIPLLDRWIDKNRYLNGLRGKSIPIRLRGSFGDPNVDETALRGLGKEGLRGAAEELLKDQLERGLRNLFRP